MKMLITGASGLLGSAASVYFRDYFDVTSTYASHKIGIKGCKTEMLDITDAAGTKEFVSKLKPDVILHTASLVGINLCEKDRELACKINVQGAKNISDAAAMSKSKLAYISTDYVFDGSRGMYSETDSPNPINYYGTTKLEGEKFIDTKRNVIVRTSIYGWNVVSERKSFSTWAIDELKKGSKINLFTDQFNSMMLVNDLAKALKKIIDKDFCGIVNLASTEKISKHEFALELCNAFKLDKSLVNPITLNDMAGKELRPKDTSLDVSKALKELKIKLPDCKSGILQMKKIQKDYFGNFTSGIIFNRQ